MAEETAANPNPANPAATATPTPPTTPTAANPAATATPQVETVTIAASDYQQFLASRARLQELQAAADRERSEANQREIQALAEKGQIENALRMLREESDRSLQAERQQRATIEERSRRYALDGELSRALAACNLVPGGAEQLTQLWRGQFTVEAQGDSFAVRTPTFQSVGDFVAQQLARPEYGHFVRAQNPGGGTGGTPPSSQTPPASPTNPAQPPQPKNMGEAVVLHMQSLQKQAGDPRQNMALPMGLRAAR